MIASLPSGAFLGAHAEVDEVVPVERSQQKRGGNAEVGEDVVGLALGVKVRHLVFAHEGGHAVVAEGHPLARVFEGGPDDVLQAGVLRRLGHGGGVGQFLLRRKMGPEEGDAEGPVGPFESALQALDVVNVGRDHLGAQTGQRFRLVGVGVSGECARGEIARRVVQDGADQTATLRPGGSYYSDDLLSCHVISFLSWLARCAAASDLAWTAFGAQNGTSAPVPPVQ